MKFLQKVIQAKVSLNPIWYHGTNHWAKIKKSNLLIPQLTFDTTKGEQVKGIWFSDSLDYAKAHGKTVLQLKKLPKNFKVTKGYKQEMIVYEPIPIKDLVVVTL